MIGEYAGIVAGLALLAATLTGAYGQNVTAVFASSGAGVAAVGKAARAQHVPGGREGGVQARAVREARACTSTRWLDRRHAEPRQCGLTLIGQDAARQQAKTEILGNRKLRAAREARRHRGERVEGARRRRRLSVREGKCQPSDREAGVFRGVRRRDSRSRIRLR